MKSMKIALFTLMMSLPQLAWGFSVMVQSDHKEAVVKEKRKRYESYVFDQKSDPMIVSITGPATVELSVRLMMNRGFKSARNNKVTILRDDSYRIVWDISIPVKRGGMLLKPKRGKVTKPVIGQVSVPAGKHSYKISFDDISRARYLVSIAQASSPNNSLALGPEEDLSPPAPAVPASKKAETVSKQVALSESEEPAKQQVEVQQPDNKNEEVKSLNNDIAEAKEKIKEIKASAVDVAVPAKANENDAIHVSGGDGTVAGSMTALADAIANGYSQYGQGLPFYRVAISAFKELGEASSENHLGELTSELLTAELSKRKPFVVVERQRLSQIMREHRLKDLGIVDESTTAEFGKILGAQSIITGTVGDAGPKYVVTIRQVDSETGKILVAGSVEIDRAGLIALSADAVVLRSKGGAMFRSALIPGWGQIYNKQGLKGAAILTAGLGSIGGFAGFYVASGIAKSKYEENTLDVVDQRQVANDRLGYARAFLIAYGVVWAINLIDAYMNGENTTNISVTDAGAGFSFAF